MDPIDPIKKRQSDVSKSGKDWEDYVHKFLTEYLKDYDYIEVIRLGSDNEIKALKRKGGKYKTLYEILCIGVYYRGRFRNIPGDADIVVYSKKFSYPICIVSCKTSLHGRLTETLFYAVYYRLTRKIRYVLATPDRGKQSGSHKWESEWGTDKDPSKSRLLASLFLDGVYVENREEFMPKNFNPKTHKTSLGGIVKGLDELPKDIIRWHSEYYKYKKYKS